VQIFTTSPGASNDPADNFNLPTTTWSAGSTDALILTEALPTSHLSYVTEYGTYTLTPEIEWAPTAQYIDGQYVMWFSAQIQDSDLPNCLVVASSSTAAGPYSINVPFCDPQNSGSGMFDPSLFWANDGSLWLSWSESDPLPAATSSIELRQLASTGLTWYTADGDDPTIIRLAYYNDDSGTVETDFPSGIANDTVNGTTYGDGLTQSSPCTTDPVCFPVVENPQLVYNPSSADDPIDVSVSLGAWNWRDSYHTVEFGCPDLIGLPSGDATASSSEFCDTAGAWDASALVEGATNPGAIDNPAGLSVAPDGEDNLWALFAAGSGDDALPRGLFFEPASTIP